MKSVKFYTLGCKVNQYDTQSIRERFLNCGFQELNNGKGADFCIINTCTVTLRADHKSKGVIRDCIRDNPQAKIIVTGCLVEKDAASLSKIKGAGLIISKRFFPEGISSFSGHTRAFLKIQDGCDNFCAYCKVPLVRGRSKSRTLDKIVQEAGLLVESGFKEIVLSGICLGAYGLDLTPKLGLVDVIEALEDIDGLLRIRLSSIEISDVSCELIDKISRSKKLCRHLHIPLQSGDDQILKDMNRKYCVREYSNIIERIKNRIPEIAITTDVLVGFPGETERNFRNTVNLIQAIVPLRVHIFPYSPRAGSLAFNFQDRIGPRIVNQRAAYLKAVADSCSLIYKQRFLDKDMDVLIEGRVKDSSVLWEGYTDNYIKVRVKFGQNLNQNLGYP